MSALAELTLDAARDGLLRKEFSARELAEAHIGAIERARPLNAFITETPERALEMAAESDRRIAAGDARPLEGLPLAIKDLFCTRRRPHHRRLAHPAQFRAALRIDGQRQPVARGRGAARQDQPRRVRDGLVQRHQLVRPRGESLDGSRGPTRRASRAAAPAARRRRWRQRCAWARSAPTPAARSASRRRCPASSA